MKWGVHITEVLIVLSYIMQFFCWNGIQNDMKFVVQEMWDYPLDILPWVIISRCVFTDASIIIVNDFNIFTLA